MRVQFANKNHARLLSLTREEQISTLNIHLSLHFDLERLIKFNWDADL